MKPAHRRSVHRYLLPLDAFVRIRVMERGSPPLRARPGLSRESYRELVIKACCPELGTDPRAELARLCPEDPPAAEDLLYQLCIEVNPALDIHTVRLCDDEPEEGGEDAEGDHHERPSLATGRERAREGARGLLRRRARGLERRLAERVIGQPEAIDAIVSAVRRAAAGLSDERRPLGCALFVGRTGTGKTELARALADELYGPGALVRIDCAEFGLGHETARLAGAPPGYVGHEHGGLLTEALERRPDCVVLFDEIEKAHPRLHHLLLSVLDDGHMTDGRGRRVDFTRAFVLMTSNAGAIEAVDAARRLGFAAQAGSERSETGVLGTEALREVVERALARQFTPEFLGRIGRPVLFRELDRGDAARIAERILFQLALRLRRRGHTVAFAPAVADWLVERGFSPEHGARELEHALARELEGPLCDHLLASRGKGLVRVSIQRGRPRISRAA